MANYAHATPERGDGPCPYCKDTGKRWITNYGVVDSAAGRYEQEEVECDHDPR